MSYSRQRRRILSPATRLQGVTPPPTPVGPIDPRLMMSSGLRDNMRAEEDAYNQRDQDQAYLAQQQAREQERADKAAEAAQKKAEAQSQKLSTYAKKKEYDAAGINSEMDALGNVVAKKDAMTGKTDYRDMQAPVQYPETGKPYQMKRGEDGKMKQEFPDAKATIGDNPNDPKDPAIYRKNKAAPWDRIDPEEGLLSPEPEVKRESSQRLLNDERKALQRESEGLGIEMRNPDNKLPSPEKLAEMRARAGSEYADPKEAETLKRADERDAKLRRQNEIATRNLALETTSPDDYAAERLAKLDPNTVQAKRADLMKQKSAGIKALEAKLLEEEASLQADYQAFVPQTQGFRADQEAGIREKLGQFRLRKQMVAAKRQSLEQSMTEFNKFGEDIYQQATAASQAKAEKESIGTPAVDAKPGAPKAPAPALPLDQAYEQAKTGQMPWKQSMENQRTRMEYLKADGTIPETAKVAERWQQVLESMDPEAGGEDSGAAINAAFQTMQAEMQAAGAKDSAANEKMRNQAKADAEYLNNLAQSGEIFTADTPEQQASAEAWGRSQFAYDNEDSPSYFAPWGELSINPTLFFKDDAYTSAVDSATAPPHAKERAMQALPALQQGLAAPVFEAFLTAGGIAGSFKESIKKTADQNKWTGKGGKDIAQVVSRWTPEEKVQAVKDFMASPDYSPNWNQVALGASGGADAIQQQYYGMKAYFGIDQAGSQKAGEEEMRQQEVQGAARQTSGGSQPLGALTQGAMSLIPSIAAGVASGGAMALVGGSAAAVSSAALVGGSIGAGMQSAGSTMIEATKGIARKEANARSIDGIDPTPGAPISNAGLVEARVLSTVSGAITATLTRLGGATGSEAIFGAMFGGATKAAVLPAVQRTFVQKVIKGAGDFTYHGAREAFMEELPDQALQNVLAQNTFNPERDLEEGLWETTWVSFLLGGGMNAVTQGAGAIKEKFNGAKLTEKYAQAVTLGQGVAMAQSPDIITDALAGSPLEARTPEVLSTLAEIDARIVDGMAELNKATTPAAKLYSNKQLAFAYAEREAAVVALKKELNAARLTAAMEEIDAALPPEEEATPGMSTLPTANEKAFAEDKRRAKGLIKIAAGQEQSLDEDELNLLGLARDDKGKLIEATFTSDASGVTIRSGSRVKIEDGKLVIRQGTIDRMVALFPKTEPLIGKSEAQRRAEIQAKVAAAEAAKAAPATGTAPDPNAASPAATPAAAPAASPTTAPAPAATPASTAAPAAGMQTFAVEVEGMADPVMMDAANVEQAKDMAFAAYPGKIIRSVKATGSAPTSNAAPAAKDSSTVDFKESEQSLKDKLNNPGKPKTAPALEEQTTYTDLADLQRQSKARLVDGWTLTSNMSSKVDGKTTNTARWSKPAEPAAPEVAPATKSKEAEESLKVAEDIKEAAKTIAQIIAENEPGPKRDAAFTKRRQAAVNLVSRLKKGDTVTDEDGNVLVVENILKDGKVWFEGADDPSDLAAMIVPSPATLADGTETELIFATIDKFSEKPAPEVPQNETPAPDTAAPDVTPAGITKALAATVKGKPSKKQAKRFIAAGQALSKEIARWQAAFPGGVRLVTGTPSGGVQMGTEKLELLLDMPRLVESIDALGDNTLGWVEDVMIEEAIHGVVEKLVQEGKLDLMGIWNEIPAETKAANLKAYPSNSNPENQAHEYFRLWLQYRLKRAKGEQGDPAFTEAKLPAKAYALLKDALNTLLKYFRDMAGTLRKQGASEDTIGRVMAAGDLIEAGVRALDAETAPTNSVGKVGAVSEDLTAPTATEVNDKAGSDASGDPNAVVGTFTTAKGSTYKIYGDGTTERNKAARDDVGHEGDSGAKPRTVRTIYVAGDASSLSAAGLTLPNPEKGARVIIKDGKASMLTWNDAAGQWGVAPESRDIAFFDEPAVGRSPLELWRPKTDVQGYEAYSGMHAGNKITKITPAPAAPETPAASITPENREALKQVAKMFNPDGNGTQEGRGYATQILDGLRIIDAGEMAGGMERLRGVATNARPQYPSAADALDDTLNKMEGAANAESEEAAPDPIRDLILSDESRLKKAMAMKKLSVERGETVKQTQEYIESRLVQIADEIARGDGTPEEKYAELVRIYDQQPLFSSRTSTSMENQAYSTPIPMAYVLGHMTGVTPQTSVYDGTAGNGVLAIGADLENSVANEIDSTRRQGLESMGIGTITDKDATLAGAFPSNHAKVDVVHLNPPFGTIPNVNYQGYGMRKLEHIITVRALEEAMKANGTAAIIMGATMNSQEQSKGAQWVFENYLYGNYNVVDNFEVTGDLYGNQGAKWPVRILVLAGKRTNPVKAELAPKTVDRLNTWPEVWERAQRTRYEVERQRQTLGTEGQSPVSPDSPEGATQPENEGAIPGGKRGSSGKAPKRGRSGGNRPGKPDSAKQPGVGSPAVAPPGLVQQPQDSTPASEPPVGGGKPAPRVEGGSGGRPDGSGGRPGDSTRGDGATGSGNGTPQNAGGLTPAQIRLKALAARLDSGGNISSAPIEQAYSRDIPRSEAAELRDIAESLLFDDGIDTPALLAETLQALGLQNLSENVWSGIRALKASLPATVDWSGTYRSLKPNKPPEKPDAPRKKATATETQIPYDPESNGAPFETLIPRGIGEAVRAALEEITANRGPIDEYVAGELDMSVEDLLKAMSAEQVDGVAMAIYQMETGGALIIGDETGIGKGRQAASLIRYAVRKGKIPVFFTKDPKLFSDMWGDLQDINTPMSGPNASATDLSVRPLIFGAQDTARIVTPEGALVLKPATLPQQRSIFARARTDGFAQQGYNAIFTTYSQIRKENDRQAFLEWLAENDDVVIVLDEAHEAAGNADSSMQAAFMMGGTVTKGSGPEKVETTKSGLLNGKGAMHPRGGALYLSATFAKRPDNMPVYFRTDLRKAGEGIGQVVDAMSNGGVALQQAVTEALAEAGQYIRRERDFTGVSYSMKRVQVDDEADLVRQVDEVTEVLSAISNFSSTISASVAASTALSDNQQAMTEFASIVHNQVGQLLLAAKADAVVAEVLAAKERGEKPIVALMNTMESFLSQYIGDMEINVGDAVQLSWSELLQYALSRTLRVSEKMPDGSTQISTVDPEEFGLGRYYQRVMDSAKDIQVTFPVSPIDYIIQKAELAGVKMGELTGRQSGIQYTDFTTGAGTYKTFKKANKNTLVNGFNGGALDAMLLNASGSTGLSIHASEKFKDQQPRHMIIAQPALDINVFIQTLGRIKRTGIVMKGQYPDGSAYGARYSHLTLPLNAELRPAVMAARKMKSLNANTTGESDSAVKIEAEDLMNRFGNRAVAEYLNRNPELASALNLEIDENKDGEVTVPAEVARQFTGRMSLRPDAEQGAAYAEIIADYRRAIEQAKVTGDYDLEIIVHDDWDGVQLNAGEQIITGTDESSILTASVYVQPWEITDNRPTPSGAEMLREFQKENGSVDAAQTKWEQFAKKVDDRLNKMVADQTQNLADAAEMLAEMQEDDAGYKGQQFTVNQLTRNLATTNKKMEIWGATKLRMDEIIDRVGQVVQIEQTETNELDQGMLTQIKYPDLSKGLRIAPSAFKFTYLLDRPGGRIYPSLAQFRPKGYSQSSSNYTIDELKGDRGGKRQTRTIIVGNPVRAYAATGGKGKVVRFKSRDGELVTGLMMPRNWRIKQLVDDPRMELTGGASVARYFANMGYSNGYLESGENIRLQKGGFYKISAPVSRRTGKAIFFDKRLIELAGEFTKTGNRMVATFYDAANVAMIADRITEITGKRLRGQDMSLVQKANGVDVDGSNATGSKRRPKSAVKEAATKAWTDYIEGSDSATIQSQSPAALLKQAKDANNVTPESGISRVSNKKDHLRVGTASLGTDKKPVFTPKTSNISGALVPEDLLERQMAAVNAKNYPHLPQAMLAAPAAKKRRMMIDWIKLNLKALHDAFPAEYRARATHWYDGANRIAQSMARRYSTSVSQAAGVIAVFSPQKDWFRNVTQAQQFMSVWNNDQDTRIAGVTYAIELEHIINAAQATGTKLRKEFDGETAKQKADRQAYNESLNQQAKDDRRELLDLMRGKTVAELDDTPHLQAWAIRTIAQVKFGRHYQNLSPEGDVIGIATKLDGEPSTNMWGSGEEIEKAVRIIKDGSRENISNNLGQEHKVRNFYNNIIAPNSGFGDATIDTHAVAAAHLMPYGSSAAPVAHNFGTGISKSDVSGVSGLYHLYLDAYREAAAELGIQPRQLQSITWEAIRLLFPKAIKNKQTLADVTSTWQGMPDGNARKKIISRGIPSPVWAGTNDGGKSGRLPGRDSTRDGTGSGSGAGLRAGSGSAGGSGRGGIGRNATGTIQSQSPADLLKQAQSSKDGFYSAAVRLIEAKMPSRAPRMQVVAMLTNSQSGVKVDELKWTGVVPWLSAQSDPVSKEAVLEFMRGEGNVQFKEVTSTETPTTYKIPLGGTIERLEGNGRYRLRTPDGSVRSFATQEEAEAANFREESRSDARYAQYQLPGGENYREVVLSMPEKERVKIVSSTPNPEGGIDVVFSNGESGLYESVEEAIREANPIAPSKNYTSSHFPDVQNYVAHMRTNERTDADGEPGLFIEEIQSDRHQDGRKKGYDTDPAPVIEYPDGWFGLKGWKAKFKTKEQAESEWETGGESKGIPDAPFRVTWPLQMFKRALRDAVASDKQWIGWTDGATQNDRFDLSKQVDAVKWGKSTIAETYDISYVQDGQTHGAKYNVTPEELPDIVGKEVAQKIIDASQTEFKGELRGLDLKVGGSGMKGFYDKILPAEVAKYVKQWGGVVEQGSLEGRRESIGSPEFFEWYKAENPSATDLQIRIAWAESSPADIEKARKWKSKATPIWKVAITPRMASAVETNGQAIYSQSPADLLAQANVSMTEVDALAATASAESDGDRTIGDPTRAGGAGTGVESDLNDVMLAASNIYADDIKEMAPQKLADLDAVVRGAMEADPEGNLTRLIRDGMRGVPGNAFDVRMRQMLKEWLARQPATQERREQAAALTMGDHLAKRTASQILGASRDMWVTKAERFRAFMMDHIYTPPPGTRYKILNAPTEEEREALLKKDQERIQRIIDALAKMGVTIEDVLNGGRKLLARRGEMNRTTLKDMDAKKMAAAMDTMDATQSFKDIAAKNGMTVEQVKAAKAEAMAKVMEELRNRRKMAQRAQGIISSQPVGDDPWVTMDFENMAKMSDADAEVEMERIMKELGWFDDAQQGKRRTTKRRVPKTPPAGDGSAKGPRKSIPQPELELEIVSIFHGMDVGNQVDVVRMKHIVDTASGSGLDVLREIYINWLLSGPVTQATNIVGNVAFGIWNTVLVRAAESTVNAMTGNNLKDSASFGEFIHIFKAAMPGLIRGGNMAWLAWGSEHDFFESMAMGDAVGMGGSGLENLGGRKAISGWKGQVVRIPGRSLMAADSGLKTFFGTMEVAAHAYRLTRKAGLAPGTKAYDDSMNRLMYMAGSPAWDAAVKQAEYNAFQQELNESKNPIDFFPLWVMKLNQSSNPIAKIIGTAFAPFVKTPYNLAKAAVDNSPLGTGYLLYLIGKGGLAAFKGGKVTFAGEPEFITTVARQVLAWSAYFALQAISEGDKDDDKKKFLITGSPPKNRGEADLQKRALGGAYMIRLGGVSHNYGRMDPFATVAASTVDVLRSIKRGDSTPEVMTNLLTSLAYQAKNKTFLTGLASIGDILEGRTYGKDVSDILLDKVISSAIPNIIKQPMRNWADTEMDTKDAPWWHPAFPLPSAVGTKLDPATGEEKRRTGNSMTRMFMPSASVPDQKLTLSDKVLLEWNRLRQNDGSNDEEGNPGKAWAPKLPSPTRKLPNQQDIELNEFARNYLVKRRAVLAQKALAGMPLKPDQTSIDLIKKAYLDGSTQAWNEIKYKPSATLGTIKK